jgi:hypothetical protein
MMFWQVVESEVQEPSPHLIDFWEVHSWVGWQPLIGSSSIRDLEHLFLLHLMGYSTGHPLNVRHFEKSDLHELSGQM